MRSRGFTLMEVLVVIFIIGAGAAGAFTLISRTIVSANFVSSRLTASYLAQEGIEIVRNIRDTNLLKIRNGREGIAWDSDPEDPGQRLEGVKRIDFRLASFYDPNLVVYNWGGSWRKYYVHWTESGCRALPSTCQDTPFKREIIISYQADDIMKVESKVSWLERGQSRQVVAQELLYKLDL